MGIFLEIKRPWYAYHQTPLNSVTPPGKSDSLDTENVHENQGYQTPRPPSTPPPPFLGMSVQMRIIVPIEKEPTGHQ